MLKIKRSLAISIHMTGIYMGQALGGFGATIADRFSWNSVFQSFGIIGILYSFVLILFLKEKEKTGFEKETPSVKTPLFKGLSVLLSNISFWLILFYFAIPSFLGWAVKNWLPTLFAQNLNIDMVQAGRLSTITTSFSSLLGVLVGGILSDRWVRKNIKGRVYTGSIGLSLMMPALMLIGFGSWFFSLTKDGKPLVQPYNIFSDCFAIQAFGQLYKATGNEKYADIARTTFEAILKRKDNPKRQWSKAIEDTRPLKNFASPMILCNLSLEIEHLLPPSVLEALIDDCIHEAMEVFYDTQSGQILENVTPDGQFSDGFEGRLLNPGHAIEAMWFIMDLGERKGDKALIERAKNIALHTLESAWGAEYGGILYFKDINGHPLQQLEWD